MIVLHHLEGLSYAEVAVVTRSTGLQTVTVNGTIDDVLADDAESRQRGRRQGHMNPTQPGLPHPRRARHRMQPPSHPAHQADRPGPVRNNHHPRQRLRV